MKKLFKKIQMIITTLAIIIAVAGYVNYSGKLDASSGSRTKTVSNTAKEQQAKSPTISPMWEKLFLPTPR